jgi:hypothetical protein
MYGRKSIGLSVLVLAVTGLIPVRADADMLGSTFGWQYYGGGSSYDPGTPGAETNGSFTDDGGIGGTFIEPTGAGPLPVFNIDADDTTITFDYSVDEAAGPWSSSPLSLTPTIFNGIAINLLSAGSFASVAIDPNTNMAGFGASNFSFSANQIEVDWQNLPFSTSTVVEFDVALTGSGAPDAPEPGTCGLILISISTAGLVWRRRVKPF